MPTRFKHCLMTAVSICLGASLPAGLAAAEHYTLLSRSSPAHMELTLDSEQWRWVRNKRELLLGTSAPDYPPFDLTTSGHDYEGFTADYAGIISNALDLPIKVQRFDSREAAITALTEGQIDMLGSANGFEAVNSKIRLSSPYAVDQPVLVSRIGETRPLNQGLADMRLSMVYHYLPMNEIEALYPKARLMGYPSFQSAINAVSFNQADVFLGDTISTQYLINKGYLNNVQMANFGKHEATGFSFAVRDDSSPLLAIINQTLKVIPLDERVEISKRWGAGSDLTLTDQKLQLTQREERWVVQHPTVKVVFNEAYAPLTFADASGNFRGITADLLELVRLRTGLRFEFSRSPSMNDMMNQVSQGQADLIGAMIPSEERESRFNFSRPYIDNSFVLVTRPWPSNPQNLDQLQGKRVVLTQASPLRPYLRKNYPDIVIVEADNPYQALDMLSLGRVEGAITSLLNASYFISSGVFTDRLQMTSTVGEDPALVSMATSRNATELSAILDKALASITPQDLAVINNRWRSFAPANGMWHDYQRLIYQILIGAGLLLLGLLAWNAYMRQQIKKRELAERALNDQIEFMSSLVNGTPHPIYVRDHTGLLLMCNDSYLEAFSARREDIIGKSVVEGILSDTCEAHEFSVDYQRVMSANSPLILDRTLHIGDRELTIYHWILPFRDSLGEVKGIIGGWLDISERRLLLEDLRAAKDQADDANRAKSTFLATMSHEIRTPMNAVIGMLELALKRADQGHLDRPAIEVAYSSANDLLELIGDILDIARIESGRLALSPERANLRQLVESVVRVFEGLARQKSLSLQLDLDSRINVDVLLDPLRFKQILSNLISNAIKFTEKGHIRISLQTDDSAAPQQLNLRVLIQDSGIGISEQDRQRLFEPFAQADNSGQLARTGAGLGLVICRSLCEMMGGTLTLSSEPGVGTQVSMTLSLTTLQPLDSSQLQRVPPALTSPRLNILVVDDHPANRLLLCQQLEFLGHHCEVAQNGAMALQSWLEASFDVIIADCNMPVMNGYDLTRAIRRHEQEQGQARATVLGFTANAQPEEKKRCLEAGMDDCLFKPISLTALSERLADVSPQQIDDTQPSYNLDSVRSLTGDRPEMVQRLLVQLISSNQEDREALAEMIADNDRDSLREMAHKIRGAARIIRAINVINTCEALEDACNEQALPSVIQACQQAINSAMLELEQALLSHQLAALRG